MRVNGDGGRCRGIPNREPEFYLYDVSDLVGDVRYSAAPEATMTGSRRTREKTAA